MQNGNLFGGSIRLVTKSSTCDTNNEIGIQIALLLQVLYLVDIVGESANIEYVWKRRVRPCARLNSITNIKKRQTTPKIKIILRILMNYKAKE